MKKFLIAALFLSFIVCPVFSSEMTEDYFDIATNYVIEGNYREALNYLDKILMLEPQNSSVQDLRNGLRQIVQGNNKSFILPKSPAVKQSIDAKKAGNRQGELSALNSGNDYWAYYFLGEYYKENGDYSQAVNYFVKSINSKPNFIQCYLEIAVCYFEQRNYSQAVTYLNQYLKLNPDDDFGYFLRARCQANLGNNDSALNDILTAMAFENSLEYRFLEGKILYNMRRYDQAAEKLEKLSSEIQTAELYKYLGLAQAEIGNKSDAIINLEKVIIFSDDDKMVNQKYNELKMELANE